MGELKQSEWARLPSALISSEILKRFSPRELGVSVAALKAFIAIACFAKNDRNAKEFLGCADLTYDQLEDLTGLSRAMVCKAIKKLEDINLISVQRTGRSQYYKLPCYESEDRFCKIPKKYISSGSLRNGLQRIKDFSPRRKSDLNALKLYLVFLKFRDRKNNYAFIGYDKIEQHTGIQRSEIRHAISVLAANGLIVVNSEAGWSDKSNAPNGYFINGLGRFNPHAYHDILSSL